MNGKTQVAVLGTLAEFHQDPVPYDLAALVDLVAEIHPDLLCLDITQDQWQQQSFADLPPEYGQALLPLAAQTDIVIVPIGDQAGLRHFTAPSWRGRIIRLLRSLLARIQATAPGPDALNQGWRHDVGAFLYNAARRLAGENARRAYHAHIEGLTDGALKVVQSNPGSRILVVTNIQYCHHIRPRLQNALDVQVTSYFDL